MRTIILYFLSLAVTGVFAFFSGRLLERREIASSVQPATAPVEARFPRQPARPKKEPEPPQAEEPTVEAVTDTLAVIAAAAEQLSIASVGQAGQLEMMRLIGKLPPGEISAALAEAEKLPHGKVRQSITAGVIARWAESDGRAAMDYTLTQLSHANRPAALAAALSSWSDHDPSGALAWYQSKVNSDPDFELAIGAKPVYLLPTIFQGLVARDISTAYSAFSRLSSNEEKDQALDGIAAASLSNEQTQHALDLAGSTLGEAARAARLRLVSNWGQREPAAAAAWVSAVRDPTEKSQLARAVAQTWIAFEPTAAVPWLLENTPQAERPTVVELATTIWVNSDPNATAEWLGTLPKGEESDLGVSTLARNIVAIEPVSAFSWASTIENEAIRRQTMIAVISEWRFRDPEGAVEALNASDLPPETIADYLKRTVPAK